MPTCTCDPGSFLCPKAEHLWTAANLIYSDEGYDAWKSSEPLFAYNAHIINAEQELRRTSTTTA